MFIRNSTQSDMVKVVGIYEAAKKSLKDNGVDQWQTIGPGEESLEEDIHAGISKVCECKGDILATAALYVGHEPTYDKIYDGKWLTNTKKYGIIHRIAVKPDQKGKGLCEKFFDYLKEKCIRAGVKSLRCDTHKDNIPMQKVLLKYGFTYCGVIVIEDNTERLAYEFLL